PLFGNTQWKDVRLMLRCPGLLTEQHRIWGASRPKPPVTLATAARNRNRDRSFCHSKYPTLPDIPRNPKLTISCHATLYVSFRRPHSLPVLGLASGSCISLSAERRLVNCLSNALSGC